MVDIEDPVKYSQGCAHRILAKRVRNSPTARQIAYLPGKCRTMFVLDVGVLLDYEMPSSVGT